MGDRTPRRRERSPRGRQTGAVIDAAPIDVFAAITDIERLPEWNQRIAGLTRAPDAPLAEGVEWTVQMSVPPAKWQSRSRVVTYHPARLVFEYTSQSDGGNPSYVVWRWSVAPVTDGSSVTVDWSVNPKTFWRRLLFAGIRRQQLQSGAGIAARACLRPGAQRGRSLIYPVLRCGKSARSSRRWPSARPSRGGDRVAGCGH